MIWRACILWLVLHSALHAQEFLSTETALSDDDFYRIVSCAAPPAGECNKATVRWPKTTLTIGISKMNRAYLGGKKIRADAALTRAINEINAVQSAIRINRDDTDPDIPVLFLDIPSRSKIQGSGFQSLEGTPISGAGVRVFTKDGVILKSVIIFTTGLQKRAYESAMLEEITQGLGLLTDIGGSYYETRSIFSQSSNALTKLAPSEGLYVGSR